MRSFGSGGSGRWATDCTVVPCGLGTIFGAGEAGEGDEWDVGLGDGLRRLGCA